MSFSFSGADVGGVPPDIACVWTMRNISLQRFSTLCMTRPVLLLNTGFPVCKPRLTAVNAQFQAGNWRFSPGSRFADCHARFQSAKAKFRLEERLIAQRLEKCWRKGAIADCEGKTRSAIAVRSLQYGMVVINTGLGRKCSRHGIEDYVEMKYLCLGDINR